MEWSEFWLVASDLEDLCVNGFNRNESNEVLREVIKEIDLGPGNQSTVHNQVFLLVRNSIAAQDHSRATRYLNLFPAKLFS